jgi:L-serine dehydratase
MNYSVFEVFRIGIGPSSSHTVGPMSAANSFVRELEANGVLQVCRVRAGLYGSLALTGVGHGTDFAVIAGLMGEAPEDIDPAASRDRVDAVCRDKRLPLGGGHEIDFDPATHLEMHKTESLPEHPNGMMLEAFDGAGRSLYQNVYFSIGGGAVLDRAAITASRSAGRDELPHPQRLTPSATRRNCSAQCRKHDSRSPRSFGERADLSGRGGDGGAAAKVWRAGPTASSGA